MSTTTLTTGNGSATTLSPELITELRGKVRGAVLAPGESGYDAARTIWNAMIDRRPALIIRAAGAADVIQAVTLARTHGLVIAIKGGGHNIAGNAVGDGGLMLDLSAMKSVRIDPRARTARVEPGVTLGELTARPRPSGSPPRSASTRPPGSPDSRWAAASAGSAVATGSPWTT